MREKLSNKMNGKRFLPTLQFKVKQLCNNSEYNGGKIIAWFRILCIMVMIDIVESKYF